MRIANLRRPPTSVYRYSTSQILDTEDSIHVTSGAGWRERKMLILHRSMRMVLDEQGPSCKVTSDSKTRNTVELSFFPILASYCCDIPEGKGISAIRHCLFVQKPSVRCLSTMKDIRQRRCTKARIMVVSCQAKERRENVVSFLGHSGSHMSTEQLGATARLSKKDLRDLSLSEWPSFMEGLQLVSEDILTSVYSIFQFEPLQNFYYGMLKVLKECIFTYLEYDDIQIHPGKAVYKRRPLGRMRT